MNQPPESVLAKKSVCIDHIAIAVEDLDSALAWYTSVLGFALVETRNVEGTKTGMRSAVLQAGNVTFVLVQGTSPESQVSRFIEHYGPGVQHVAIRVEGIDDVLVDLQKRGLGFQTTKIAAPGLIQCFSKREPNSGLMLEVLERFEGRELFESNNVQSLFNQLESSDSF